MIMRILPSQARYLALLLLPLVLVASIFALHVSAATTDNLSGYAWSPNIGWISFNCTNTGSCATSPYGVSVAADGTLGVVPFV